MSVRRHIHNRAARVLLSPRTRSRLRTLAKVRRRALGRRRVVRYFHQVDDPYSHLASQVLARLVERYDIELSIRLVRSPSDEAAPDRPRLVAFARSDAGAIAGAYGLEYTDPGRPPTENNRRVATRILAGHLGAETAVNLLARVGEALWSDDTPALADLADQYPPATESAAARIVDDGTRERGRRRHYGSAMFEFEGEWYWGVDRLHHLERRLSEDGARRTGGDEPLVPRLDVTNERVEATQNAVELEFFPSMRSPYTAICMPRALELAARLPVDFTVRPVLPMVMRGLAVPLVKRLYIVRDTLREAEVLGIPFGDMYDPVGRPVERVYSLFPFAREHGRGAELLSTFCQSSFGAGFDTGTDAGLRRVVEEAGLSWDAARAHLDGDEWREELEGNRLTMLSAGLWGVPSFRVRSKGEPDFTTWGQDRLWLVEREIRRRL